jgi:hypothetical protein
MSFEHALTEVQFPRRHRAPQHNSGLCEQHDMHWELYGADQDHNQSQAAAQEGNQDERLEAAKLRHTWPLDKLMCIIRLTRRRNTTVLQLPLRYAAFERGPARAGNSTLGSSPECITLAVNVHRQPVPASDWHHRPQNGFYGAHQCSICVRPASSPAIGVAALSANACLIAAKHFLCPASKCVVSSRAAPPR